MANRKTKKDWGTILLQMALDARQEGDLVTAELLVAHAMDYFDESDRLASRWRNSRRALATITRPGRGSRKPPPGRIAITRLKDQAHEDHRLTRSLRP